MQGKCVTLTIDGQTVTVPEGTSVLDAARKVNIHIPTLCYLKGVNAIGACRMCLVDVGARSLMASCVLPATQGMVVKTNTPEVREARRINLQLILSNHERTCLTCVRSRNCELQALAKDLGVEEIVYEGHSVHREIDDSSPSIIRDPNKCVLCRRCIAACQNIQQVSVIGATNRGFNTIVESPFGMPLGDAPCINCGQCIQACPVGALREKDDTDKVWEALADPELTVVVQTAPSIRVALGEEFGMPIGTRVTGKMVAALRRLGFARVFDTDFAADLTILEEGTELIERMKSGGKLPIITSCSPGWVKFCEHFYPDFLENLSTCKSPQQMMGAVIKHYWAQKNGVDPRKVCVVSVMPCTAKKFECGRDELAAGGVADVDIAITTRELAAMIKEAGIGFTALADEPFDDLLGDSTGAGVIFGATGGVTEAALRTVYEILTGKTLETVEFTAVRGLSGVKEATVRIGNEDVSVAVAHGTGNARKVLDAIRSGEKNYHMVEIMACPGGCVTGGGQPIVPASVRETLDPRALRARAIYDEDESMVRRKSHENPSVRKLYEEFLGQPGGHKSHELLHTHYQKRPQYISE